VHFFSSLIKRLKIGGRVVGSLWIDYEECIMLFDTFMWRYIFINTMYFPFWFLLLECHFLVAILCWISIFLEVWHFWIVGTQILTLYRILTQFFSTRSLCNHPRIRVQFDRIHFFWWLVLSAFSGFVSRLWRGYQLNTNVTQDYNHVFYLLFSARQQLNL